MLSKFNANVVDEVSNHLTSGGVVLLPTDTVYGLAVHPDFDNSVNRLFALKRRPRNINLPIMVSSGTELEGLGFAISMTAKKLLMSPLVPGSLTIVMGFNSGKRPKWLEERIEAAVRIPNESYLLSVLARTGPLLVTSANSHGNDTPETLSSVLSQLDGEPDLAIDGGHLQTVPSTLINCRLEPPVVERHGAIPESVIMEYLK